MIEIYSFIGNIILKVLPYSLVSSVITLSDNGYGDIETTIEILLISVV
jgi:hypothetical protein